MLLLAYFHKGVTHRCSYKNLKMRCYNDDSYICNVWVCKKCCRLGEWIFETSIKYINNKQTTTPTNNKRDEIKYHSCWNVVYHDIWVQIFRHIKYDVKNNTYVCIPHVYFNQNWKIMIMIKKSSHQVYEAW